MYSLIQCVFSSWFVTSIFTWLCGSSHGCYGYLLSFLHGLMLSLRQIACVGCRYFKVDFTYLILHIIHISVYLCGLCGIIAVWYIF